MKTVDIVLAGIGGYGRSYLTTLLEHGAERGGRLVGCVDPFPEPCEHVAELERLGVPVKPDLDSLLSQVSADLVVISAPTHYHAALTCRALAAGAGVLCEKPLAATVQEGRRMAEAEQGSSGFVGIGYQWSFSAAVQALKHDIMAGAFGPPVRARTMMLWPRTRSYYARNAWAGRLTTDDGRWILDSAVNNASAHYLHNMFYLLGPTIETSAVPVEVQAELYRAQATENHDTAAIRCRTEAGTELLFYTTHSVAENNGPVVSFEFERAEVVFTDERTFVVRPRTEGLAATDYGTAESGTGKLWQCVDAVRTGGHPVCGVAAALSHTLCVNGAHESMPEFGTFPAELRRETDKDDGDCLTWVVGLAEALAECYERGLLPSELGGLAWARPGRVVDLAAYDFFPGGREGV